MSIKRIFAYGVVCIAAQASLVELAVTVRDPKDQAIAGLRREDFQLFDRGERQPITFFGAHTSAPDPPSHRTAAVKKRNEAYRSPAHPSGPRIAI